ncbi:transmembrane protein 107-like [Schistocerca piceifrons]|uniref:transmembrane protein 107-like n=1 Tax=Schistocerca piceifrons TaxID=274613 RepID=UPI001F5E65A4|nr:transmembrane protein 107-like [Schistocerca piceifrons]
MVYVADSIVPARFLTLTGHLTITLLIFWAKDESVKVCLPPDHAPEDYEYKNKELTVGLSIALGLIGFEFLGFLFGITMFMPMVAMISISCHASACVLLAYFIFDEWDCRNYWWVFGTCSAVPALTEATVIFTMLAFRKL